MRFCKFLIISFILLILIGLTSYQQMLKIPKELKIATGSEMGAYYHFAKKYQEVFKSNGINLQIQTTAGSVEALKLLEEGKVDVAFVQGGTAKKKYHEEFVSLASLFYEPLWVFYNGDKKIQYLNELKGKKISIGKIGSGSHAMFKTILSQNGIEKTSMLNLSSKDAIKALKDKTIDAFCVVVSPEAPMIVDLLKDNSIKLMSFKREIAYKDRYDYINSLTLSEGVIDLAVNVPKNDVKMLTTTASLVTKADLNSDLQRFIIKLIKPIHKHGGFLEPKNYFPTVNFVQIPISEHTKNYILKGDSWMERFLPFWLASLIENLLVLVIPLIPLYIIYSKFVLPSYILRLNHKIYKYNESLRSIEMMIDKKELEVEEIQSKLKKAKNRISRNCILYLLKTHVYYALIIKADALKDSLDVLNQEERESNSSDI